MVLDYLLTPKDATRHPAKLFVVAALFVSFGVLVELFLPSLRGSIIIFAMVPAIPLVWLLLFKEEQKGGAAPCKSLMDAVEHEGSFLARHSVIIEVFSFFFLGALVAYAFWYAVLPPDTSQALFSDQLSELENIRGAFAGAVINPDRISFLFFHNLQVMALMFVFCLLYGVGSIYLLLWNASIIGVVLGEKLRAEGLLGIFHGFLSLVPHGIFEIAAYFVASLAGGILSICLMRGHWKLPGFKRVLVDVAMLAVIAVVLVGVGAFIEGSY